MREVTLDGTLVPRVKYFVLPTDRDNAKTEWSSQIHD